MMRNKDGNLNAAWRRKVKQTGSYFVEDFDGVGKDERRVRDLSDDEIDELAGRLQEKAQELLTDADALQTFAIFRESRRHAIEKLELRFRTERSASNRAGSSRLS